MDQPGHVYNPMATEDKGLMVHQQEEYRSLVMTPRDAEKIVKAMRVGGNKAIPLGRLSISAPLLDLINSCDTLKSTSPSTEALTQCMSDDVLKEAYLLLINSVSGSLENVDSNIWQYWYSEALNSSYIFLKSLQLRKGTQVEMKHFQQVLSCAISCVKNLQLKRILIPIHLFVHLFLIISACLTELSPKSLDVTEIALAAIPYFNHYNIEVQVVAMYVGHFIIPLVEHNSPIAASQLFNLNLDNVYSMLQACGCLIPTTCCLKVLLTFSILPNNRSLLVIEGIPLFCFSIIVLSPQVIEQQLSFCLLERLLKCDNFEEDNPSSGSKYRQILLDSAYITKSLIPNLSSAKEKSVILREIKEACSVSKNREQLRKCGMLQSLESLLETTPHSDIESDVADLIYTLLSDEQNSDSTEEIIVQDAEVCEVKPEQARKAPASTLELLEQLKPVYDEVQSSSEVVNLHAQCLHGLLKLARDEFLSIMCFNRQVVSIHSLVKAVNLLRNLCIMYEDESISLTDRSIWEKQIVLASTSYLSEFFYISFKALDSIYSDSIAGIDKFAYEKVLKEFLAYLHFTIEQWSRMSNIQETLIKNGTFYLLINEMHTHTTTHLLDEDVLYVVLTSFYNVLLNSQYSHYFRVLVKHHDKLLLPFFENPNLKYLAKFCFGCLYSILSKRELDSLQMSSEEIKWLSQCLKRESSFFGGMEQLVQVISNLANFPRNWNVFVKGGIVHTLISLVISESGYIKQYAFRTLLNMIPQPDVTDKSSCHSQHSARCLVEPLTNTATKIMKSSSAFMKVVTQCEQSDVCRELCNGIKILISPVMLNTEDLQTIATLMGLERFYDCWRFCECFLSLPQAGSSRNEVLFYKAASLYHIYNKELPAMLEKSEGVPGFQYKTILRTFCQKRVLEVIRIFTTLVRHQRDSTEESMGDKLSSMILMLDKALLDSLVFNVPEVGTCLLCHTSVRRGKLTRSHYIPKSIIQEFVRLLGAKPGSPLFYFLSVGKYPTDWQRKTAGQVTYSMLCQTCDGEVLSKDENTFKKMFFDKVYSKARTDITSLRSSFSILYDRYLLRFAAGLFFRNVAPRYSQVSADIGNVEVLELGQMMQMCRTIIFENTKLPLIDPIMKIFLFALPSTMPKTIATPGWDQFVKKVLSPYIGYRLHKPGSPELPTRLFCCMVKMGVLLFVKPFDPDLEKELLDFNPFSLIRSSGSNSFTLYIPRDEIRMACIPEKLWWNLAAWTKKEIESGLSTVLSVDKLKETQTADEKSLEFFSADETSSLPLAPKYDHSPPVVIDMLPPGFSLNFDKYNTIPDEVIKLPPNHYVLLHQPFRTSTGAEFFIVLTKALESAIKSRQDFSWPQVPCVLVYLHQPGTKYRSVLKVGFYISESDYSVQSSLPGGSPKLLESPNEVIQNIIRDVPEFVYRILKSAGFLNLKSLLFWSDSLRNVNDTCVRIHGSLDIRCRQESCNYCDMRCDCCMQPHLEFHQTKSISHFKVQSCSKECSEFLFKNVYRCTLKSVERSIDGYFAPRGHTELYRGFFSTVTPGCPGMNSMARFSICKYTGEEVGGSYNLPQGVRYVKFWQRCLQAPTFVVYSIDDQFNALECLHFEESASVNSIATGTNLMHLVHGILVKLGIPGKIAPCI